MLGKSQTTKNSSVRDCLLLISVTLFIYLPFLGLPVLDGNEPVRVIIAKEMMKTGNWIIPILHGKPYFTKPPMMNWLIAGSGGIFGTVNEWTSRVPSVLSVFATAFSIYVMTGKWLKREGRLFAAVTVLGMIGLIKKGRTAEIDTLFIFFVTLILLIWINGYTIQRKPLILWSVSLTLLGIGFLAKGPQIIGYFYLSIFAYLFYRKNLSFFFSRYHLIGFFCFFFVLALYLFFVLQWVTPDEYLKMWASQIAERAESKHSLSFLQHILTYPIGAVASFLPCMLFLIPLVYYKNLRKKAKEVFQNEILIYCFIIVVVNFPLYWLLPNARVRYFLPAGPFVAIGTAAVFEFYLQKAKENPEIQNFFKGLLKLCLWTALISSVVTFIVLLFIKTEISLTPSLIFLVFLLLLLNLYILYKTRSILLRTVPIWIILNTGLFYLTCVAIDTQLDLKKENNPKSIAKQINPLLPEDIGVIYEIGYDRFLGTTCYLDKEVIQLDNFSQLKSLVNTGGKIYFIFDTQYLNTENEREILSREIAWNKVYSHFLKNSKGDIVVGYLKQSQGI